MEYIETHKQITKTFIFDVPFIPLNCINITVFGSCQGLMEIPVVDFI